MARRVTSPFFRFLRIALILMLSVGIAALSIYAVKLDQQVRTRFAGSRWALPAQVYASPLELYPGALLSLKQLQHELERLGYRANPNLEGPGAYLAGKRQIDLLTRPFMFWDGAQSSGRYQIEFDGPAVREIRDISRGSEPVPLLRLDPMLIGSIYPSQGGEDRILVKLSEVPPLLPKALILVEDRAFRYHFGLNPKAILRAGIANLRAGRVVQGASTITQQLVKNFFLDGQRTWARKLNEALMAFLLEIHYSKDEILEAYINEINLGQDGSRAIHGFGLASQFYFNKPLSELRLHEIALLVALPKGASEYNPRRHPERALERRNLVLSVLAQDELIAKADYDQAVKQPLALAGGSGGTERYPAFVDLVRAQLAGQYQVNDLTDEGLRIFTTLDPRVQEAVETRITADLPTLEKSRQMKPDTLEAAGIVSTVEAGEVLAIVGGRDFRFAGFNRALEAQRPIGSLAKPFVYLAALMQPDHYNLHSMLEDQPIALKLPHGAVWSPQNYDKEIHGVVPLYMALAQSYNLATVHVGLAVGVNRVLEVMRASGFDGQPLPVPSALLGALDMSPLQVAQMYGTLAARGYRAPLISIREVTNKDGQPLRRYNLRVQQVLPEGPVYLLNWALEQVTTFGTARSLYSFVPPSKLLAGKTGTTDDYRDSWFAGYGADRVAVIWVGRDDNKPTGLSGAAGALQIWARLMRDLDVKGIEDEPPPMVEMIPTDPDTGLRADDGCVNPMVLPFVRGYAPQEYAPCADRHFGPLEWFKEIFR
jgi:penicillin-binding protein 1B